MFDFKVIDDIEKVSERSARKAYFLTLSKQFFEESERLYEMAEKYKRYAAGIK